MATIMDASTFRKILDATGCSDGCFLVLPFDRVDEGFLHLAEHLEKIVKRIEALERKTQDIHYSED
jgi:hypothetical protein